MSFERDPIPDNKFKFDGPTFKHDMQYMTQEGYPLGTTCWYYRVEYDGLIKYCAADTAEDALKIALAFLVEQAIEETKRKSAPQVCENPEIGKWYILDTGKGNSTPVMIVEHAGQLICQRTELISSVEYQRSKGGSFRGPIEIEDRKL